MIVKRPWGTYEVLSTTDMHQVKHIVVDPGQQTSLQSHDHRSEHWVIVSGVATVTLGEKEYDLAKDQSIFIPAQARHRISNKTKEPVVLIEVQTGDYFGEDDIIRYEDDYGR